MEGVYDGQPKHYYIKKEKNNFVIKTNIPHPKTFYFRENRC
jgi:hypothetical protein